MRGARPTRVLWPAVLLAAGLAAGAASAAAAGTSFERSAKQKLPAGKTATATARCPPGSSVTGGSVIVYGANTATSIHSSYPVDGSDGGEKPDDGWRGRANSRSAGDKKMATVAVCAKSGKYSYEVQGGSADPGYNFGGTVCPNTKTVAGGGAFLSGKNTSSGLAVTEAFDSDADMVPDEGWTGAFSNGTGDSLTAALFAICAKSASFEYVRTGGSAGTFSQGTTNASCPEGTVLTGGGGNTGTATTTAELATGEPFRNPAGGGSFVDGWTESVNNNSGVPLTFYASAVCQL